jgi:hypothetical protein
MRKSAPCRSCRPRPCGRIALTLARCPTLSINLTPLPPRPLLPSSNSFPTFDCSTARLPSARPRPLNLISAALESDANACITPPICTPASNRLPICSFPLVRLSFLHFQAPRFCPVLTTANLAQLRESALPSICGGGSGTAPQLAGTPNFNQKYVLHLVCSQRPRSKFTHPS